MAGGAWAALVVAHGPPVDRQYGPSGTIDTTNPIWANNQYGINNACLCACFRCNDQNPASGWTFVPGAPLTLSHAGLNSPLVNTAAFEAPSIRCSKLTRYGNEPNSTIRAPARLAVDLALTKETEPDRSE